MSDFASHKWMLLTHHIPPKPSGFRVKIWRKLQEIGAIAIKSAVYVLPNMPTSMEDFQWLRQEIQDAGGDATVFVADAVGNMDNQEIIRAFQQARDRDYENILDELNILENRRLENERLSIADELQRIRRRLDATVAIDFFEATKRTEAMAAYRRCEVLVQTPAPFPKTVTVSNPEAYRNRRWITRKRPHIDRLASAWLIRGYIDSKAEFVFVEEGAKFRKGDVPFDMFGVDFGHHGDNCTFETLLKAFGIDVAALNIIARIVHDADLKDGKFNRQDTDGIEKSIRAMGMRLSDESLLAFGFDLFDGLLEIVRQEK